MTAPTTIVFANGKGGVGKTTLSLAVTLCLASRGKRIAFRDTDRQSTLTASLHQIEASLPAGLIKPFRPRSDADFVIVDAPPRLDQTERAFHDAMTSASLVCFPCAPALPDLWTTADTVRGLQTLYPTAAYTIALNRVDYRTSFVRHVRDLIEKEQLPAAVLDSEIPALTAFSNLPAFGWSEIQRNRRALDAINAFTDEILAQVSVPTSAV